MRRSYVKKRMYGLRRGHYRQGLKRYARRAFPGRRARSSRYAFRRAVATINRSARGFTGIEVKFYDQGLVAASLTTNTAAAGGEHDPSATLMLNTVTQGDGESQRDGRRITMKSIFVTGLIDVARASGDSVASAATAIFIALVMDTQTNGATLASENVFLNPAGNAILGAQPLRNLQFTKRFRILATRKFILGNQSMTNDTGATGGVIASGMQRRFQMFSKLNTVVNYTGTTETVANIADNSLHIIAWCSSLDLVPKISYTSRLRFVG